MIVILAYGCFWLYLAASKAYACKPYAMLAQRNLQLTHVLPCGWSPEKSLIDDGPIPKVPLLESPTESTTLQHGVLLAQAGVSRTSLCVTCVSKFPRFRESHCHLQDFVESLRGFYKNIHISISLCALKIVTEHNLKTCWLNQHQVAKIWLN